MKTVEAVKAGIESGIELERTTRTQREQAEQMLVSMKDVVSDALKKADVDTASATTF